MTDTEADEILIKLRMQRDQENQSIFMIYGHSLLQCIYIHTACFPTLTISDWEREIFTFDGCLGAFFVTVGPLDRYDC